MINMKVTEAEQKWILANRKRLELESRDWDNLPFITMKDLSEMSPYVIARFIRPKWIPDDKRSIFRNTTHSDNFEWLMDLAAEHQLSKRT
jgi:hypothetical protein